MTKPYMVVFGYDYPGEVRVVHLRARCHSLEEAKEVREVAGDLVFASDGKIVQDQTWLWEWEKDDPNSHALSRIAKNVRAKFPEAPYRPGR